MTLTESQQVELLAEELARRFLAADSHQLRVGMFLEIAQKIVDLEAAACR